MSKEKARPFRYEGNGRWVKNVTDDKNNKKNCNTRTAANRNTINREHIVAKSNDNTIADCNFDKIPKKVDYLIIGSGPAGAVLARKLSDDFKYSVAVVEAGPYADNRPEIIDSVTSVINSLYPQYFWQQSTANQTNLDNRILQYTTGNAFGGATAVNGLLWVRPSRELIAEWYAATGDPAWAPDNVVKIFKEIEDYHGTSQNPASRGTNGKLQIRQTDEPITNPVANKLTTAFQQAAVKAGFNIPIVDDYNVAPAAAPNTTNMAFSAWQQTQSFNPADFGTRVTSTRAYLDDVLKIKDNKPDPAFAFGKDGRQLYVLFNSTTTRILFQGKRAIGATFIQNGEQKTIYANEVIVSAGPNSVNILQQSGVGPSEVLKPKGIPVVVDNKHVGKNLADHTFFLGTFLRFNNDDTKDKYTDAVAGAFYPDPRPGKDANIRKFEVQGLFLPGQPVFIVIFYLARPKSSGSINVFNANPLHVPIADPNYIGDPDDFQAIIAGVQTYYKNFIAEITARDPTYIPLNPNLETINDPIALAQYLKQSLNMSYHYGCAVRMAANDKDGAADSSGRIYGASNLRVVDNNLQPVLADCNTQSVAYLIGHKIATDIINQRKKK